MTSQIPMTALIGLLAGGVGAALSSQLFPTDTTSQAVSSGDAATVDLSPIEGSIERLSARLNDLEMQLAAAPVRSDASQASMPEVDLDQLKLQVSEMLASLQSGSSMPANFESWFETAQENVRERERLEREAEREQRVNQLVEDRLTEMAGKLSMDQKQIGQMRDALTEARTAATKVFEDMRNGGFGPDSRDLMRASMDEIRNTANTSIQGFLSPTQYETYTAEYGDNFGMGRGGFMDMGGGRGGNFGGGQGGNGGGNRGNNGGGNGGNNGGV